jgi:glycosyltransferase involved in cell wall biosynthesis
MGESVDVSVVIPTFNRAKSVVDAVQSVVRQTRRPREIVVVDDGSTDGTREALAPFSGEIKYVRQENAGVSAARNRGIRESTCAWVAFLDSDDVWFEDKIEIQTADVAAHPEVVLHVGDAVITRTDVGDRVDYFASSGFAAAREGRGGVVDRPFIAVCQYWFASVVCTLVRRETLTKAGLFDESLTLHEDYDLFCRAALVGPWFISMRKLAEFRRFGGSNLSQQTKDVPLRGPQSLVTTFKRLLAENRTTARERFVVRRRLTHWQTELGRRLLANGDAAGARRLAADSLRVMPRWKGVALYAKAVGR